MSLSTDENWIKFFLNLSHYIDSQVTSSGNHSLQVARHAIATAKKFAMRDEEVRITYWASLLHDIGKIGVPEEILVKHGPLDDKEWQFMRLHPTLGANIIRSVRTMSVISPIILFHQEKFDGSGYPYGLKGDEIPLGSRILAVVDAFDAMTNERVYRSAYSTSEAIHELISAKGKQFDPHVVEKFLTIIPINN